MAFRSAYAFWTARIGLRMSIRPRLMVMGGLAQHVEPIRDAKRMGYHVIVSDYLANSPGKQIADEAYDVDITDVDAMVALCRRASVDGVVNYCVDPAQKAYLAICESLSLHCYGTAAHFEALTNKDRFKEACVQHGLGIVETYDAARPQAIRFPVIVKPADGRASKGVTICHTHEYFEDAIATALSYSRRGEVVVEKYLHEKPVVCAKYFVIDGRTYLLSVSDTHTLFDDGTRQYTCASLYPSRFVEQFLATEDERVRRLIQDLGIRNGPISLTGFFDDGVFRYFDPSFRLGGNQHWRITEHFTGINVANLLSQFAIEGAFPIAEAERSLGQGVNTGRAAIMYLLAQPGVIAAISGVELLSTLESVIGYHLAHQVGEKIRATGTSDQVVMRVLLASTNSMQLIEDSTRVGELVSVVDETGRSLLFRNPCPISQLLLAGQ